MTIATELVDATAIADLVRRLREAHDALNCRAFYDGQAKMKILEDREAEAGWILRSCWQGVEVLEAALRSFLEFNSRDYDKVSDRAYAFVTAKRAARALLSSGSTAEVLDHG